MKVVACMSLLYVLFSNGNAVFGMSDTEKDMGISLKHHALRNPQEGRLENPCIGELDQSTYVVPARFGRTNYCYKIELLIDGGTLSVDREDTGCANFNAGNAYAGSVISTSTPSYPFGLLPNGEFFYQGAWTGVIIVTEDLSLSEPIFQVEAEPNEKTFYGFLTIPLCGTTCKLITPSEYVLPAQFGKTNYCYKLQVEDGGTFSVDKDDPGCSEFDSGSAYGGSAISTYQQTNPDGEAVYEGPWSGSISLKRDPSLSEPMFQVLGDVERKTFTGILTVPTCFGLSSSCQVDNLNRLGDEYCDGGAYNTPECGYDKGGCVRFNDFYPSCDVEFSDYISDGFCDGGEYNTPECDYDGGDCVEYNELFPECNATYPGWIGNGYCNLGNHNTPECDYDGGDCDEFNELFPNCDVASPSQVGDGLCNGGDYNTPECGYDGGDCDEFNELFPNCDAAYPPWVGNGFCDGGDYNTTECGNDGGDC